MAEVTGMTPEKIAQEINNVKSYIDGGLSEKADKTQVTSDLSKKADITKVASDLSKKANTTYINEELSKKADKTQVSSDLSKKADVTQVSSDLSKKASTTYVNEELSKKANITYVDSLSPLKSFAGVGFPEGEVTAPIGSIYTDTSATNGAIRWIKTSDTDNTGWSVEYGDTGWRNAIPLLRNGWKAATFIFRRVGDIVEVRGVGLDGSSATDYTFFVPPEGFMPGAGSLRISASTSDFSVSADRVNIGVSGATGQVWRTNMNATSAALTTTYLTNNSWPTTLPGLPV